MELSVENLRDSGGFTGAPVKREVSWETSGEKHTADVYVRRLSYSSAVTDAINLSQDRDLAADRIANCICDGSGKPVFTVSDIVGVDDCGNAVMDTDSDGNAIERGPLSHALTLSLLAVIGEVNELGKSSGKDSVLKQSSGMS